MHKMGLDQRVNSRCIFCKKSSLDSKSIEHIIPQSLGNIDHVLPAGVVCDKCNNYYARKVEGPLLSTPYFQNLRARQAIVNKRGRTPPWGLLISAGCNVALNFCEKDGYSILAHNQEDEENLIKYIRENDGGRIYVPASFPAVDKTLLSRFIAKIALEILAHRLHQLEGWETDVTDHPQLDLLRNYARFGVGVKEWPYYERKIYDENHVFEDGGQTIHEFDLLWIDRKELYAVICIFGIEYTINMGEPELEGYEAWLKKNCNASPLYIGKNKVLYGGIK